MGDETDPDADAPSTSSDSTQGNSESAELVSRLVIEQLAPMLKKLGARVGKMEKAYKESSQRSEARSAPESSAAAGADRPRASDAAPTEAAVSVSEGADGDEDASESRSTPPAATVSPHGARFRSRSDSHPAGFFALARNKQQFHVPSESWDAEDDGSTGTLLDMVKSPFGYYRNILAFLPSADRCCFAAPRLAKITDGIRVLEIPDECRDSTVPIKSAMLKRAHDTVFSAGMFLERYGWALSLAMSKGLDAEKLATFLLADVVSPVLKMCLDVCHLIGLYTDDKTSSHDMAAYGLALSQPDKATARAPIALRLDDIRQSAAVKGAAQVVRAAVSRLSVLPSRAAKSGAGATAAGAAAGATRKPMRSGYSSSDREGRAAHATGDWQTQKRRNRGGKREQERRRKVAQGVAGAGVTDKPVRDGGAPVGDV